MFSSFNVTNTTIINILKCPAFLSAVPLQQKVFFTTAFALNSLIATCFNFLVFIVYYRTTGLNKWNYYLVLSLAIGDFIVGIILSPISAVQTASSSYENCFINKFGAFLVVLVAGTAYTIAAIAYDRFTRIRGADMNISKSKRFILYLALPWFLPFLFALFKLAEEIHFTILVILYFVFIYSLLLASYIKLYKVLNEQKQNLSPREESLEKIFLKNRKAVKMIMVLICVFILLTCGILVYRVCKLMHILAPELMDFFPDNEGTMVALGQIMVQINSSVNPLLYFLKVQKLRKALIRLFRSNFRTNRVL